VEAWDVLRYLHWFNIWKVSPWRELGLREELRMMGRWYGYGVGKGKSVQLPWRDRLTVG
jgi:hypothetical protein